jgi:2-desacetyl-2-hydroxyethyl bacteriochlorophyllide A dehydrogenase
MIGHRIVFTGPRNVAVEKFEIAAPSENEILVESLYTTVSPGTERANLLAQPNTLTHAHGFPFYPGYSSIGRIIAVGSNVRDYWIGQIIAALQPHVSHYLMSVKPEVISVSKRNVETPTQFGAGNTLAHPGRLVWPLPVDMESTLLKACATFALWVVGLGGIRRARIEIGEAVLVIGLGAIGLTAARFARLSGAFPILALDPERVRHKYAAAHGIDAVFGTGDELKHADLTKGKLPNVVIEATGRPEAISLSFQLSRPGGRVILLGSTRGITHDVDFYTDVHRKGLNIIGAHQLARPTYESSPGCWTEWDDDDLIFRLIASRRLEGHSLITHEFPLAQAQEAYRVICENPSALSLLFDWTQ